MKRFICVVKVLLSARCRTPLRTASTWWWCQFTRKNNNSMMENRGHNKVYVCIANGDNKIDISFVYGNDVLPEIPFNFSRSKDEKLVDGLSRIRCKIEGKTLDVERKAKKKKSKDCPIAESTSDDPPPTPLKLDILSNGEVVDDNVPNDQAWVDGNQLRIDQSLYDVIFNPPLVVQMALPKRLKAGFPVYPEVSLRFCDLIDCNFSWYRSMPQSDAKELAKKNNSNSTKLWSKISEGYIYETTEEDVERHLKVMCIPKSGDKVGMPKEALTLTPVENGPGMCPFEYRHEHTRYLTPSNSIRCISYNILADIYADTDTARTEIFPYCPGEYLALDYRRQLLIKEIIGYNGDIICLQEVDAKVFKHILSPALLMSGLQGVFSAKADDHPEGVACFFRQSKFKLTHSESVIMSEVIEKDPEHQVLWEKVKENEKFCEKVKSRNTVLQLIVLESVNDEPNKRIVVGNTHLYFHPSSSNVRLVQSVICVHHLDNLVKKYLSESPGVPTSFIFSGDFNSSPKSGIFKLLIKGMLPEECVDWKSNPDEAVRGMELKHHLNFDSACGTPSYTNFTEAFSECLDYIFYDSNSFIVSDVVPFPDHDTIIMDKALPSRVFPSDHLALVCTLEWK